MAKSMCVASVTALGVCLLLGGAASGAGKGYGTKEGNAEKPEAGKRTESRESGREVREKAEVAESVTGKVTRVAPLARNLFVLDPKTKHVVWLQITSDTEIASNGKPMSLEQIAHGSEVRASYELRGDEMVAQRIEVLPQKPEGVREHERHRKQPPRNAPGEEPEPRE